MPERARLYFDSSVYLALLNNEPGRVATVSAVIEDAERRSVQIFTSTVTLAEVAFFKPIGVPLALGAIDERIDNLLQNPRITTLVQFTPGLAIRAREYVRSREARSARLTVLDAIHLASAATASVDRFCAYDADFRPFGRLVDFQIGEPETMNPRLNLGEGEAH